MLVVDVMTETTSTLPCGASGDHKWSGIASSGVHGSLVCAPDSSKMVLQIKDESFVTPPDEDEDEVAGTATDGVAKAPEEGLALVPAETEAPPPHACFPEGMCSIS